MNKRISILIIVILLILAGVAWFLKTNRNEVPQSSVNDFTECQNAGYPVMESYPQQCRTPDGRLFVEDIGNEMDKSDLIRVSSPRPNQTVGNTIEVFGEALGTWFFEASFPARVVDANGKTLAQAPMTAQGEWMTENFVPFEGKLSFAAPSTTTGKLILEKSNASGLPENADSLEIPLNFSGQPSSEQSSVSVFFGNSGLRAECGVVVPLKRTAPKTEGVGKLALEQLLLGPSESELKDGYSTSIPQGVKLNSLKIESGKATADFSKELNEGVAGSCRVLAIRSQITETLKQFPTVTSVTISVNGDSENILQP